MQDSMTNPEAIDENSKAGAAPYRKYDTNWKILDHEAAIYSSTSSKAESVGTGEGGHRSNPFT